MTSILNSIYEARRAAAPGTCLTALSDDQVRAIADRIQTDMATSNLQITDVRPVDQQVADLMGRHEQLRAEYSKQITALSCARVLLRQVLNIPGGNVEIGSDGAALLEAAGEPDLDDRALASVVIMGASK